MDGVQLSNKKRQEFLQEKEKEREERFNEFKKDIDEMYFDIYGEKYGKFFDYYNKLLKARYLQECSDYEYFRNFVKKYSNHYDIYVEEETNKYLDMEANEEEVIEEDNYDFLMKETNY